MKVENYAALEFPSRSANEGFARAAAACFAAQLDPTHHFIMHTFKDG